MRLLCVPWPVVALQFLAPPLPSIGAAPFGQRDGLPYRQRLRNFHNVQYHADLEIGGQVVSGIFDTGSFDLVVVSTRCKKCPEPEYNHSASSTYVPDGTEQMHQYGSGPALSRVAYEHVSFGPFVLWNQTFFEIIDHNISALDDASFDAIVGIGGVAESDAINSSMVQKIGAREYSICLEEGSSNPGWLTWGGDLANRSAALELSVSDDVRDDFPFPDMVVTQTARSEKRRGPQRVSRSRPAAAARPAERRGPLTLDARALLPPTAALPL